MEELDAQKLPELSSWQVVLLRLTVFLEGDPRNDASTWWLRTVETEPENQTSRNRGLERSLEGAFRGGRLVLETRVGRVDWLYAREVESAFEVQGDDQSDAALDRLPSALDAFSPPMERWLETAEGIKRMAFGAIVRLPVKSGKEGYIQISAYLPFDLVGDRHRDLLFQINRPSTWRVRGTDVTINRLSKWSVSAIQLHSMDVTLGGIQSSSLAPPSYACQVELDVNTDAERGFPLPREHLVELFEELVRLGKEIVERGVCDEFPPRRHRTGGSVRA
jgi:hypothetical protein